MADQIAVVGGVDTHTDFHQAAAIDNIGRHLATASFPTTPDGYRRLLEWMRLHGDVLAVGVEGTGAYGSALARFLRANEVIVVDVDRPDRKARRASGKSDPVDAYAAATAVLSGRAQGRPKTRDGIVEAIRSLRVVRRSAIKSRTQTINQIRTLIVSAPANIRERLRGLPTYQLIAQLARSRPGADLANPTCAVRTALRRLARRYQHLTEEIAVDVFVDLPDGSRWSATIITLAQVELAMKRWAATGGSPGRPLLLGLGRPHRPRCRHQQHDPSARRTGRERRVRAGSSAARQLTGPRRLRKPDSETISKRVFGSTFTQFRLISA
jgi:hypothetical protein